MIKVLHNNTHAEEGTSTIHSVPLQQIGKTQIARQLDKVVCRVLMQADVSWRGFLVCDYKFFFLVTEILSQLSRIEYRRFSPKAFRCSWDLFGVPTSAGPYVSVLQFFLIEVLNTFSVQMVSSRVQNQWYSSFEVSVDCVLLSFCLVSQAGFSCFSYVSSPTLNPTQKYRVWFRFFDCR